MLDSFYHMTLKIHKMYLESYLWCESVKIFQTLMQCYIGRHYVTLLHIYVFIGLLKHNMNTCMKVPMFIYSIV